MSIEIDRDLEWLPMMNKIMANLKELKDEIGLVKSNTKALIDSSNKKNLSHSRQIPKKGNHNHKGTGGSQNLSKTFTK